VVITNTKDCMELNQAYHNACLAHIRRGEPYPSRIGDHQRTRNIPSSLPPKWDTVTTIAINGEDTTRTITIRKEENWEEPKADFSRFVDMYVLLGVINLVGTGLLVIASFAN
jgi:hypothetical protein